MMLKSTKWKEIVSHNDEIYQNGRDMSEALVCVVLTHKIFENWGEMRLTVFKSSPTKQTNGGKYV